MAAPLHIDMNINTDGTNHDVVADNPANMSNMPSAVSNMADTHLIILKPCPHQLNKGLQGSMQWPLLSVINMLSRSDSACCGYMVTDVLLVEVLTPVDTEEVVTWHLCEWLLHGLPSKTSCPLLGFILGLMVEAKTSAHTHQSLWWRHPTDQMRSCEPKVRNVWACLGHPWLTGDKLHLLSSDQWSDPTKAGSICWPLVTWLQHVVVWRWKPLLGRLMLRQSLPPQLQVVLWKYSSHTMPAALSRPSPFSWHYLLTLRVNPRSNFARLYVQCCKGPWQTHQIRCMLMKLEANAPVNFQVPEQLFTDEKDTDLDAYKEGFKANVRLFAKLRMCVPKVLRGCFSLLKICSHQCTFARSHSSKNMDLIILMRSSLWHPSCACCIAASFSGYTRWSLSTCQSQVTNQISMQWWQGVVMT